MESAALYIHIPFCKEKCLYCDFLSFKGMEGVMPSYIDALTKELLNYKNIQFSSIFIGGGTPTYLSLDSIKKLGVCIKSLNKAQGAEFTIEGNPGTFENEKLLEYKNMGVNRISIGAQAFQDKILKSLGRIHRSKDIFEAVKMARNIGIQNINLDLMFGLPSQSIKDFEDSLMLAADTEVPHLSCYSLIVEEGTPFYDLDERGKLLLPSEDEERDMYALAKSFLLEKGYEQYEISNFAKKGYSSKHNLVYWSMKDYIGCGAGAHSFYKGRRFSNERDVNQYIKKINNFSSAIVENHKNSINESIEEFVFTGLRKIEGISLTEFKERFNIDIFMIYEETINKYLNLELLKLKNGRMYLSSRGVEVSNTIMSDFILDDVNR